MRLTNEQAIWKLLRSLAPAEFFNTKDVHFGMHWTEQREEWTLSLMQGMGMSHRYESVGIPVEMFLQPNASAIVDAVSEACWFLRIKWFGLTKPKGWRLFGRKKR